MSTSETKTWRDKVSAACIRQLEYHRREKAFNSKMPDALPDLIEFFSSGGIKRFNEFFDETADLGATPADYEEVELSEDLVKFINTLGLGEPFDSLIPGVKRLPPNFSRIVREFETTFLLLENAPQLRALLYLVIPVFGGFFRQKVEEIALKSNVPDLSAILIAYQPGDESTALKALGRLIEIMGRSLQGKPTPKGKFDYEKAKLIAFIRENQTEELSWEEMRDAVEFGGIYVGKDEEGVENLRVFGYRARHRPQPKARKLESVRSAR